MDKKLKRLKSEGESRERREELVAEYHRSNPRISTISKVPERIRRVEEIIPCREEDCQCAQCGSDKNTKRYTR